MPEWEKYCPSGSPITIPALAVGMVLYLVETFGENATLGDIAQAIRLQASVKGEPRENHYP